MKSKPQETSYRSMDEWADWSAWQGYEFWSAPHRCRCRKAKAMSCHSEEMWESFDALWRRVQELSRQVRELEARLGVVESERQTPEVIANDKRARTIYESEVGR